MISFDISDDLRHKRQRIRSWVEDVIVPYETDERVTEHGPTQQLRTELVGLARAANLLTIQAPTRYGGWGLNHIEQAVLYEAAGWSTLGPIAMNCAAPDEGNMHLLAALCRPDQCERHLRPLIDGTARSAFAMTEPGGAGSDPHQLRTTATFDGSKFRINGHKWLISGAKDAAIWIILADLQPNSRFDAGPTLFLTAAPQPGLVVERVLGTMDRNYVEGHGVVRFDDLQLTPDALLGEPGQALRYAQMRLAPARMTHASRWLGAAERAQHIATAYAMKRTAFGSRLMDHQGVSFLLAQNEIALHHSRLSTWYACAQLDTGAKARHESSIAKAYVSEELFKVVDRCVQILGGMGVTDDTPVAGIFRDIRAFRLYDGPTEVHLYAIARAIARRQEA